MNEESGLSLLLEDSKAALHNIKLNYLEDFLEDHKDRIEIIKDKNLKGYGSYNRKDYKIYISKDYLELYYKISQNKYDISNTLKRLRMREIIIHETVHAYRYEHKFYHYLNLQAAHTKDYIAKALQATYIEEYIAKAIDFGIVNKIAQNELSKACRANNVKLKIPYKKALYILEIENLSKYERSVYKDGLILGYVISTARKEKTKMYIDKLIGTTHNYFLETIKDILYSEGYPKESLYTKMVEDFLRAEK